MSDTTTLARITQEQAQNLNQLIQVSAGLSALMQQMDARIRLLESERDGATILHEDVLWLNKLLKARAEDQAARYGLDKKQTAQLRSLMKKTILTRFHIRDLHDLPKSKRANCKTMIDSIPVYSMVMKVREQHADHT